jgi:hypothetical protein
VPTKINTDKVADAITPLVTRVANDEELREHAKTALDSARTIYARVQTEGARKAAGRKEIHNEIARAAAELRLAAGKLQNPPKKKKHRMRKILIGGAIVGGAIFGAKKLMGRDSDEFDYEP